MDIARGARSANVDLTNRDDQPLRLEITALDWEMAPDGSAPATPATAIVVYPQFLTIAPHETRRIRAATLVPNTTDREMAYRLSLAEIPAFTGVQTRPGVNLTFTTTYVLGVYLAPPAIKHEIAIADASAHGTTVSFDVRDTGSVHEHLTAIAVEGLVSPAHPAFTKTLDPGIVLAGRTRAFAVSLTHDECSEARAVTIRVNAGGRALSQTIALPAPRDCGS